MKLRKTSRLLKTLTAELLISLGGSSEKITFKWQIIHVTCLRHVVTGSRNTRWKTAGRHLAASTQHSVCRLHNTVTPTWNRNKLTSCTRMAIRGRKAERGQVHKTSLWCLWSGNCSSCCWSQKRAYIPQLLITPSSPLSHSPLPVVLLFSCSRSGSIKAAS